MNIQAVFEVDPDKVKAIARNWDVGDAVTQLLEEIKSSGIALRSWKEAEQDLNKMDLKEYTEHYSHITKTARETLVQLLQEYNNSGDWFSIINSIDDIQVARYCIKLLFEITQERRKNK